MTVPDFDTLMQCGPGQCPICIPLHPAPYSMFLRYCENFDLLLSSLLSSPVHPCGKALFIPSDRALDDAIRVRLRSINLCILASVLKALVPAQI